MTARAVRRIGLAALASLALGACTTPSDEPAVPPPATASPGPPLRAVGFDQERLSMALVVDLSGPGRDRGRGLVAAADAFWAAVAAQGGIGGQYPVELVIVDSGGDGATASAGLSAVANDVAAVALADDPEVVAAIRPLLAELGMPAVAIDPDPASYADELLIPVGLGVAARTAALARILDSEGDDGGAWCPVGDGGPTTTAMVEALVGLGPTAPLADTVVLTPESDPAAVAAGLVDCGVVWLPSSGGSRDIMLDALADAAHAGRVAVVADEIQLSRNTIPWAPGRLVLGTNGPDWSSPSPAVDEMSAVVGEQSPGLFVGSTTAVSWTAQQIVWQLLTAAFESGSFDRDALVEAAAGLTTVDPMVPTWSTGPTGARLPSGQVVAMTPGPGSAVGRNVGEIVGVEQVEPGDAAVN